MDRRKRVEWEWIPSSVRARAAADCARGDGVAVSCVRVSQNSFSGILGADTFSTSHGLLPPALKQLDLSYNPGLIGHLPPAGSSYTALRELVRTTTKHPRRTCMRGSESFAVSVWYRACECFWMRAHS